MNVMSLRLGEKEIKFIEKMAKREKRQIYHNQAVNRLWINLLDDKTLQRRQVISGKSSQRTGFP